MGALFLYLKERSGFVIKSITKIALITLVMLLMVIGVVGCTKVAETPQPIAWSLKLTGVLTEIITQEEFEEIADRAEYNFRGKEGVAHVYSGIPLWVLCGMVDDEVKHGEGAFNDELANKGYNIKVIGADGYRAILSSKIIARSSDIILADKVDGQPLSPKEAPLRLVGAELKTSQMVRNVVEIHLDLPE